MEYEEIVAVVRQAPGGIDSEKEWFDVIVELPEEYHGLFPPRLA